MTLIISKYQFRRVINGPTVTTLISVKVVALGEETFSRSLASHKGSCSSTSEASWKIWSFHDEGNRSSSGRTMWKPNRSKGKHFWTHDWKNTFDTHSFFFNCVGSLNLIQIIHFFWNFIIRDTFENFLYKS